MIIFQKRKIRLGGSTASRTGLRERNLTRFSQGIDFNLVINMVIFIDRCNYSCQLTNILNWQVIKNLQLFLYVKVIFFSKITFYGNNQQYLLITNFF
jgi:hypothetical protein